MSATKAPLRASLPPLRHAQLVIDLVRNDALPITDPYNSGMLQVWIDVPILGPDRYFNADALTYNETYDLIYRLRELGVYAERGAAT